MQKVSHIYMAKIHSNRTIRRCRKQRKLSGDGRRRNTGACIEKESSKVGKERERGRHRGERLTYTLLELASASSSFYQHLASKFRVCLEELPLILFLEESIGLPLLAVVGVSVTSAGLVRFIYLVNAVLSLGC